MTESNDQETTALKCDCRAEDIVFLPCSGASNCGQITNRAAVRLTQEGVGKMYCLAGIGAHIEGMVESARGAKRIVALDGCKTACAKNTIEHAGLNVTDAVCATEEGIEKNHQFNITPEQVELVTQRTKQLLSKPARARM